jgi:hypothetical protein
MAAVGALGIVATTLSQLYSTKARPTGVNRRDNDRERGPAWLADCMDNQVQLFEEARLRPNVWDELIRYLKEKELVSDGKVAIEEKVLTFLYICSNSASWRNCRRKVGRSIETISRNFHEVLNALLHLYKDRRQSSPSLLRMTIGSGRTSRTASGRSTALIYLCTCRSATTKGIAIGIET